MYFPKKPSKMPNTRNFATIIEGLDADKEDAWTRRYNGVADALADQFSDVRGRTCMYEIVQFLTTEVRSLGSEHAVVPKTHEVRIWNNNESSNFAYFSCDLSSKDLNTKYLKGMPDNHLPHPIDWAQSGENIGDIGDDDFTGPAHCVKEDSVFQQYIRRNLARDFDGRCPYAIHYKCETPTGYTVPDVALAVSMDTHKYLKEHNLFRDAPSRYFQGGIPNRGTVPAFFIEVVGAKDVFGRNNELRSSLPGVLGALGVMDRSYMVVHKVSLASIYQFSRSEERKVVVRQEDFDLTGAGDETALCSWTRYLSAMLEAIVDVLVGQQELWRRNIANQAAYGFSYMNYHGKALQVQRRRIHFCANENGERNVCCHVGKDVDQYHHLCSKDRSTLDNHSRDVPIDAEDGVGTTETQT